MDAYVKSQIILTLRATGSYFGFTLGLFLLVCEKYTKTECWFIIGAILIGSIYLAQLIYRTG